MEGVLRKASAISAAAALREETGFYVKEDMERIFPEIRIVKMKKKFPYLYGENKKRKKEIKRWENLLIRQMCQK